MSRAPNLSGPLPDLTATRAHWAVTIGAVEASLEGERVVLTRADPIATIAAALKNQDHWKRCRRTAIRAPKR